MGKKIKKIKRNIDKVDDLHCQGCGACLLSRLCFIGEHKAEVTDEESEGRVTKR